MIFDILVTFTMYQRGFLKQYLAKNVLAKLESSAKKIKIESQ